MRLSIALAVTTLAVLAACHPGFAPTVSVGCMLDDETGRLQACQATWFCERQRPLPRHLQLSDDAGYVAEINCLYRSQTDTYTCTCSHDDSVVDTQTLAAACEPYVADALVDPCLFYGLNASTE